MAVDIASWLHGLGVQQYEKAFRDNDIDSEILRVGGRPERVGRFDLTRASILPVRAGASARPNRIGVTAFLPKPHSARNTSSGSVMNKAPQA
jgi:hypothetical protein